MVDREARDRLAELTRHLASGSITIGEFEAQVPRNSEDAAIERLRPDPWDLLDYVMYDISWDLWETVENDQDHIRFRGAFKLPDEARKSLARTALFLQSDLDYGPQETRLTLVSALLITPVLLAGLLIGAFVFGALVEGLGLWAFVVVSVLGSLFHTLYERATGRDGSLYPFVFRVDYQEALKHPRLLCGKRAA